jgi:hypothetical protein
LADLGKHVDEASRRLEKLKVRGVSQAAVSLGPGITPGTAARNIVDESEPVEAPRPADETGSERRQPTSITPGPSASHPARWTCAVLSDGQAAAGLLAAQFGIVPLGRFALPLLRSEPHLLVHVQDWRVHRSNLLDDLIGGHQQRFLDGKTGATYADSC